MHLSEEDIISLLSECTLFRGMSYEEVLHLLSGHMGRIKKYSSGTLIAQAGDELRFLHILLQGSVKGEMVDYTGKVIKIEDITPTRPLAPAFLLGKQNRYPANITSGEDTVRLSIPRDSFLHMLQQSEKALENFINLV